jgi:hypothetical protein
MVSIFVVLPSFLVHITSHNTTSHPPSFFLFFLVIQKGNELTDIGGHEVRKFLETNSTLKALGLSLNSIGDEGTKSIAKGLTTNNSLERLYFYSESSFFSFFLFFPSPPSSPSQLRL